MKTLAKIRLLHACGRCTAWTMTHERAINRLFRAGRSAKPAGLLAGVIVGSFVLAQTGCGTSDRDVTASDVVLSAKDFAGEAHLHSPTSPTPPNLDGGFKFLWNRLLRETDANAPAAAAGP